MLRKPTILLFVKAPTPGEVKTRLAQAIGNHAAADIFRDLVNAQLRRLPTDFALEIHYTPCEAEGSMQAWLGDTEVFFPQSSGDLGDRLNAATKSAFLRGASSVICIGGDCPGLKKAQFLETEEALEQGNDLCFGPTEDGGYYLIGLSRPIPEVFQNIPWSTPHTLAASIDQAESIGLKVHLLEALYDIDEEADLIRGRQEGLL
ncbi:MAG: TIGR04282 family arsenosugar biosynthesis glycosyltransferase [Verrucomicrobiota bacterium]